MVDGAVPRKRPWYLTLALVVSILFGGSMWWEGCATIDFYRHPADIAEATRGIKDDAKRAQVTTIAQRYFDKLEGAKTRLFPLGVASFVVGLAMLVLSVRAFGGRAQARSMLVQLLGAQVVLGLLAYFLTPDVRAAQVEYLRALVDLDLAEMRQSNEAAGLASAYAGVMNGLLKIFPGLVAVPTTLCALLVFALTRPRARAFFDAEPEPASEQ